MLKTEIAHEEFESLEAAFKNFRSICEGLQSAYWVRTGQHLDADYMMVLALLKLLKER